jgi:3-oxoacyl-[acyl-carrier-protein] synthase I
MKPVYLSGRGLACALGPDIASSLAVLRCGGVMPSSRVLPGAMGGSFPYYSIPGAQLDWNERAREMIQRVALEADAQHSRSGALFIATSSFDIGAVGRGAAQMDYSAFSGKVKEWLAWTGPVYMISTACTSGLNALLSAHALLSAGMQEDALVLGIELDNQLTLGGFAALQLLSQRGSKPFGANRDGLVLGEAVAALSLSVREPAAWKMSGGANIVDGSQPTGASAAAVADMYLSALAASGLTANQIDLIKVQAAGSPGNDAVEAQGMRKIFPAMPALVSLKSVIGHTMGASGVAELALLTACLEQGVWPRYEEAADDELGVVLAEQMPQAVRCIMATILGFGGSHATVALERV